MYSIYCELGVMHHIHHSVTTILHQLHLYMCVPALNLTEMICGFVTDIPAPWSPSSLHWHTLTLLYTGHLTLLKPSLCVIRRGVELNWLGMLQSAAGGIYSTSQMDESLLVSLLPRGIATSWKMHLYVVRQAFSRVPCCLQSARRHPGQTCLSTSFPVLPDPFWCSVHIS